MSFALVARSTFWQFASQITMAGLSILTVKFVAIGLTKELAGNYNSAYGYLQLFGILADFGLYAVAVHEVSAASNRERVLGALIVLRFGILIFSLCTALLIAWLIPMWQGTPLPLGITIAALVPFFTLLAGMLRVIFQVNYKMHIVFVAEVTQRIITASLIGFFIYMGVRGSSDLHIYHMFLFIGGVGAFVLFLISFAAGNSLVRIRPAIDAQLIRGLVRKSAPYGLAFLCMAMYRQFDVTLIALLRDDYEVQNAYYGFVLRMMDMGFLLPTFLLNSVLPMLGHDTTKAKHILEKTLFVILLVGIISLLFSLLWARPLIALLTTEAYLSTATQAGSDTALRILSVPLLFNGIVLFGFYSLLTRHAWRRLVKIMAFGAALSLAINLILIPRFGFVGAAVTSVIIHVFLAILLWNAAQREMPVSLGIRSWKKLFVFGVGLGVSLLLIRPFLTDEIHTVIGLAVASMMMAILAWIAGIPKELKIRTG